jgi:hypothetical protein
MLYSCRRLLVELLEGKSQRLCAGVGDEETLLDPRGLNGNSDWVTTLFVKHASLGRETVNHRSTDVRLTTTPN